MEMELSCLPQSVCSWDFHVYGGKTGQASLTFNFWSEQGAIYHGGLDYKVEKHGPLSGHWSLQQNGQNIVDARKPDSLFRTFELQSSHMVLIVKAQSPVRRSFDIWYGDRLLGTISPVHPFTRRAVITCDDSVPELSQIFAFWLVVMLTLKDFFKALNGVC